MRYERILRETIDKYSSRIEEITARKVGEIDLKTFRYTLYKDIRMFLALTKIAPVDELGAIVPFSDLEKEGKTTIYFGSAKILNIIPKKTIEFVACHEMGHIAHLKGKTREDLVNVSRNSCEHVANYIATEVIGTLDIPFFINNTYESAGWMEGTLKRLNKSFKEALPTLGL